jgi:hypothetical protein
MSHVLAGFVIHVLLPVVLLTVIYRLAKLLKKHSIKFSKRE